MKTLTALFATFAFTTSLAAAQSTTTPGPSAPATAETMGTPPVSDTAAAKKVTVNTASGTVKSATADSLVVSGKNKGKDIEWTFGVDANTKITGAGKDTIAADLKAGDSVHVRYTTDPEGKLVAHTVSVKMKKPVK